MICLVKNVDTNETFSEGTSYRAALDKFLVKDLNPNRTTIGMNPFLLRNKSTSHFVRKAPDYMFWGLVFQRTSS